MQTLAPTWNLGDTATTQTKWYFRLFPSLNDIAFLAPIVALFARMKGTERLFSDGDTGWHIRAGEWILAHHAVPRVDLFSFTKSNQEWFAWEWGWDVIFAAVHRISGLAGVAFINALILGLFTLLVYRICLRVSNNNLISMAVTALTAAVSSIHWLARPHLISWIFALLFLNVIYSAKSAPRGTRLSPLYVLPILMVFWTNLHGGFVAGILILGCYAVGETLSSLLEPSPSPRRVWQCTSIYWNSLLLCAAATFVNPYGWQLHKHILTYLSDSELLDKIQEFQSISFHAGPALFFEVMLALAAFAIFRKLQARQFAPVLLLAAWAHMALLSARHIPLFMLLAAPFVAELLVRAVSQARQIAIIAPLAKSFAEISSDLHAMEVTPRLHLASAMAVLGLVALLAGGQPPFAPEFSVESFPIQAMPLLQSHMGARVFTTDQWADYLLYRMYPAQRVFFDGRSDFYGNDFVKLNQRLISADYDWKAILQRYSISLVVLKPEAPLSAVLKLTPHSKVLFDDGKVIVFDINSIYPRLSGQGYVVNRAASVFSLPQPSLQPEVGFSLEFVPFGLNRSTKSKKGIPS